MSDFLDSHILIIPVTVPTRKKAPVPAATTHRPLGEIAEEIINDWDKVNFAAKPYLDAMTTLTSINDSYDQDSARTIVAYFLNNASTWRGPVAKRVKAELKQIAGMR